MHPSRNSYFNGNAPSGKDGRSRSISSSRSIPVSMTPQSLLAGPPLNQAEASYPILGGVDPEDQFPVDTVHRIYNDIEKLFIVETNSPPSTPTYSPIFDSGLASKYLPNPSSQEPGNAAEQYFTSCSNELVALDALLSDSSNSSQTTQNSKSYSQFPQTQPAVSKRTYDGLTSADVARMNALHIFIHRILLLHDKLQEFIKVNSHNGFSPSMDADQNINEVFDQWYTLGMNLRDRLLSYNSFPELSMTLAAFQPKQVSKLWRLTRLLRTFVWKQKNLEATNPAILSNGYTSNQAAYKHKYSSNYDNNNSNSNNNNYYFRK